MLVKYNCLLGSFCLLNEKGGLISLLTRSLCCSLVVFAGFCRRVLSWSKTLCSKPMPAERHSLHLLLHQVRLWSPGKKQENQKNPYGAESYLSSVECWQLRKAHWGTCPGGMYHNIAVARRIHNPPLTCRKQTICRRVIVRRGMLHTREAVWNPYLSQLCTKVQNYVWMNWGSTSVLDLYWCLKSRCDDFL